MIQGHFALTIDLWNLFLNYLSGLKSWSILQGGNSAPMDGIPMIKGGARAQACCGSKYLHKSCWRVQASKTATSRKRSPFGDQNEKFLLLPLLLLLVCLFSKLIVGMGRE